MDIRLPDRGNDPVASALRRTEIHERHLILGVVDDLGQSLPQLRQILARKLALERRVLQVVARNPVRGVRRGFGAAFASEPLAPSARTRNRRPVSEAAAKVTLPLLAGRPQAGRGGEVESPPPVYSPSGIIPARYSVCHSWKPRRSSLNATS